MDVSPPGCKWTVLGMVRIPFAFENIVVSFIPNFHQQLTSQRSFSFSEQYTISNNVAIGRTDKALLGSAEMDVNMSPEFANTASILMENSPTLRTGIVVINNYAVKNTICDIKSDLAGKSVCSDADTEWTKQLGV